MLDKNERIIVEAIRNAPRIKIVIEGGAYPSEVPFMPSKTLNHDIALAVQSHYNRMKKMKALQNIEDELRRRIDAIDKHREAGDITEYQRQLIKVYFNLIDLIKDQYSVLTDRLPKLTLRDVLEGISGTSSWEKTAYEVIGGRNGKILYRSWNGNNRKLPEQYLDLEISTINGRYSIEPRVVMRDFYTHSSWKDEKQYLLCYYQITVSQPKGIGD